MDIKFLKKFISFFLSVSLISGLSFTNAFAKNGNIVCYDTISGLGSFLEIESNPNENGIVTLTKPDNSKVILIEQTDIKGLIYTEIDPFHLEKTGKYTISYQDTAYKQYLSCGFEIYPGEPDYNNSDLRVEGSTVAIANGQDEINLKIQILDKNSNPIPDYSVNLIPSRKSDSVTFKDFSTDGNGIIRAGIKSTESGKSNIAVFDPLKNQIFQERLEVVFIDSSSETSSVGGDFGYASLFNIAKADQDYGTATKFKIEGLEEEVLAGETVNLTVTIQDQDDNTVLSYLGEILFSTTDEIATIPQEPYKFKDTDLGAHTFNLAFTFFTPGTQTLTINDINNYSLKTSVEFSVKNKSSSDTNLTKSESNKTQTNSEITLTSPKAGTYTGSITFSGTGPKESTIEIYVNNNLLDETTSDDNGKFSKTLSFENGLYTIFVKADNAQSEEISFKIDTSAAKVEEIKVSPENIKSGDTMFITVFSEPYLAQVSVIINDKITDLAEDSDHTGEYSVKLQAPTNGGEYNVDVILVDQLGQEGIYNAVATLKVAEPEPESPLDTETKSENLIDQNNLENSISEPAPEPKLEDLDNLTYPNQVTGLEVTNIEANKITLSWEVAESNAEDKFIKNYKIYYGTQADNLNFTVDTFDSYTSWYIPNLENEIVYYFAVTAVDSENLESEIPSQIVSATPTQIFNSENFHASADDSIEQSFSDELEIEKSEEIIEEKINFEEQGVENVPESGPSSLIIILTTLLLTDIYIRVRKKFVKL